MKSSTSSLTNLKLEACFFMEDPQFHWSQFDLQWFLFFIGVFLRNPQGGGRGGMIGVRIKPWDFKGPTFVAVFQAATRCLLGTFLGICNFSSFESTLWFETPVAGSLTFFAVAIWLGVSFWEIWGEIVAYLEWSESEDWSRFVWLSRRVIILESWFCWR